MDKKSKLENLRKEIDALDLKILDLISERKKIVTSVVKLKDRDQIVDEERILSIHKKLKLEAEKRCLPKKFITDVWNLMIESFIEYEKEIFDKVHNSNKDD